MKLKKGFTLIELAITLVVMGLIGGIGIIAVVSTLANQRRAMEIENDLGKTRDGIVAKIANKPLKNMFDSAEFNMLLPEEKRNNVDFIFDTSMANVGICSYEYTTCAIEVCEDAACANPFIARNILFAIAEKGFNKAPNYTRTGQCNVRINKFDKNNDDKIVFTTLQQAKNLVGCEGAGANFRILTEKLPVVYRNDFPQEGIPIKVSSVANIKDYIWAVCLQVPGNIKGNLRVKAEGGTPVELLNQGNCNRVDFTPTPSIVTSDTTIYLVDPSNTGSLGIVTGVYKLRVLVKYLDPVLNANTGVYKDLVLTIAEKY